MYQVFERIGAIRGQAESRSTRNAVLELAISATGFERPAAQGLKFLRPTVLAHALHVDVVADWVHGAAMLAQANLQSLEILHKAVMGQPTVECRDDGDGRIAAPSREPRLVLCLVRRSSAMAERCHTLPICGRDKGYQTRRSPAPSDLSSHLTACLGLLALAPCSTTIQRRAVWQS